jgi:hypothetical protein
LVEVLKAFDSPINPTPRDIDTLESNDKVLNVSHYILYFIISMKPTLPPLQRLQNLFRRRKCWMLSPLAKSLGYALISVRRFLKQIGYCRSYTQNGKWYTLADAPDFDRDGLWFYKGIGFSKHGSLTDTIEQLVQRSPMGLSAAALSERLAHPCHAVLTQLHKAGRLDRIRQGGQFQYLTADSPRNRQQRDQAALVQDSGPPGSLSTQIALWVLVEHIKKPTLSFEQIALQLRQQHNTAVSPESIQRFFQEHGLKKTRPPSRPKL